MYGMFGVESLPVEIIGAEIFIKRDLLQVTVTCSRSPDQIANIEKRP